ncbi:hypothetical protein Dimus_006677 [Dionaea muscipula]
MRLDLYPVGFVHENDDNDETRLHCTHNESAEYGHRDDAIEDEHHGPCPQSHGTSIGGSATKALNIRAWLFYGGPFRRALSPPFYLVKLSPKLLLQPHVLPQSFTISFPTFLVPQNFLPLIKASVVPFPALTWKMKIFNWVHRRFHHSSSSSSSISLCENGFARVPKSESMYSEDTVTKKESLLEPNRDLVRDMIDNWKLDDILTIGTLAITPLEAAVNQQGEELDEFMDVDGDGENVAAYNEYFAFDGSEPAGFIAPPPQGNQTLDLDLDLNKYSMLQDNSDTEMLKFYPHDLIRYEYELNCKEIELVDGSMAGKEELMKKDGERITLAALFRAEHDLNYSKAKAKADCEELKLIPNPCKKPTSRAKKSLSKAKKLLPHVKEDVHPLNKFQKFMKRILKKKVHPELDQRKTDEEEDNEINSKSPKPHDTAAAAANIESAPLLHVHAVAV